MKTIRLRFETTQSGMAQAIGSTMRSWQEWEAGNRNPGSIPLAGLTRLGVNVNWLLVGDGPELIADMGSASGQQAHQGPMNALIRELYASHDPTLIRWHPTQDAYVVAMVYDYLYNPVRPLPASRESTLDLLRWFLTDKPIET